MNKPISYEAYQKLADKYAELAPNKEYNANLDRPATLSLIENVNEKKILDAGCGPGIYSEILSRNGAIVTGIDISENMLKHAKLRNGNRVKFYQANLEEPLQFLVDEEFDGIVSALAIAYIENLSKLFKEFNRVLKKDGWLVFSTEHPIFSYNYFKIENYYATQQVSCEWSFNDNPIVMNSYYHSLGCICSALSENGFIIEQILEPKPTLEFKKQDPVSYEKRMKFPIFIHFKARKKREERAQEKEEDR